MAAPQVPQAESALLAAPYAILTAGGVRRRMRGIDAIKNE